MSVRHRLIVERCDLGDLGLFQVERPGAPDEFVVLARDGELRLSDGHLVVTTASGVRFDIPYGNLRRIELDIESHRPATIVIVPHRPGDEPQVLTIPRESLQGAARLIAIIGERLP